jgi:hypothetical protein
MITNTTYWKTVTTGLLLCFAVTVQHSVAVAEEAAAKTSEATASKPKSPYAGLIRLEDQGNGIALVHPKLSPLSFDSIYLEPIVLSYADGIAALPEKTADKIAKQITKNENNWLKQTGITLVGAPEKCAINYRIRLANIKYDESKLKRSENFRHKVYGSMRISIELRAPETNEILSVWLQNVALATSQKDKGKASRKMTKSIARIAIESLEQGYEDYAEQSGIYQQTSTPAQGCSANMANSNFRRD